MTTNQNRNSVRVLRTTAGSYLAHKNIPNLSIGAGGDFTIQLWVVTGADVDGVLYSQEGGFSVKLLDGQVVFTLGDVTLASGAECTVGAHERSYIALRCQSGTLALFLGGLKLVEKPAPQVAACTGDYTIGRQFTGGFPLIRVSGTARSDRELLSDNAALPDVDDHCVFHSDCSGVQYRDVSSNRLAMWTVGHGAGCGIYTACTVFSGRGQVCCAPRKALSATHTLLLKLWPRDEQRPQCVYTAMDGSKTMYAVELAPQSDHTFQLSVTGDAGKATMSKTLLPELWQDVAAVFDSGKVRLYLDGKLDGEYAFSFSGSRSEVLVGSQYETGKPFYDKGFSGYMAYTAEFGKALSADDVALYADDPPFLFEDGLVSLLPLDWPDEVESVGATPLRVTGSAPFNMVPDITPRDGAVGCSTRRPTQVSPEWEKFSAEDRWALLLIDELMRAAVVELYGCPADREETGADVPIAQTMPDVLMFHAENICTQLKQTPPNAGPAALRNTIKKLITQCAGKLALVFGRLQKAVAAVMAVQKYADLVLTATAAGLALMVLVKVILRNAQNDRPDDNTGALRVTGICWNRQGDPTRGSLHYHKGGANLPASMTDTPDSAGRLNTLCVLVPSRLAAPTVDVTLTYTSSATNASFKNGTLYAYDITPTGKRLGDQSVAYRVASNSSVTVALPFNTPSPPTASGVYRRTHTWQFWDGNKQVAKCNCTLYLLPGIPIDPWVVDSGTAYQPGKEGYARVELLDFLVEKGTDHTDVPKLCTQALNSCGFFKYDRTEGRPYYTIQEPGAYDNYLLKLEKLVSHLRGKPHPINCVDCACIVSVCCALAGVSLPMARFWGNLNNSRHPGFTCNLMMAIGYSDWATPFENCADFFFHQFNVNGSALAWSIPIYDACLKVDGGPYPGSDNVLKKVPLLPLGLPAQETGVPIVHVPTNQPYAGQFYRERLTANGEVCLLAGSIMTVTGFSTDIKLSQADASPAPMPPAIQAIWDRFALDALPDAAGAAPLERWDAAPLAGATLNESAPGYGDWTVGSGEGSPVRVERRFCATAEETARCMAGVLFNVAHPNVRAGEAEGVSVGERCFLLGTGGVLFCRRGNVFTVSAGTLGAALAAAKDLDKSVQAG